MPELLTFSTLVIRFFFFFFFFGGLGGNVEDGDLGGEGDEGDEGDEGGEGLAQPTSKTPSTTHHLTMLYKLAHGWSWGHNSEFLIKDMSSDDPRTTESAWEIAR